MAGLLAAAWTAGSFAAATGARSTPPPKHLSALTGTWLGKYSGAFSGMFKLTWTQTGSKLRGSIKLSTPAGTYPIGGSVAGHKLNFGAVGVGATYTGSVSGKSMSGTYSSPKGGGKWSAHKR
jgi:hypothetical protein